jgi:DNA polymerase-1
MTSLQQLFTDVKVSVGPIDQVPAGVINKLMDAKKLYFDTETTGFNPWQAELALVQLYDPDSKTCLLAKVPEDWKPNAWFTDLFNSDHTFIGHNIGQFDLLFMQAIDVPWERSHYYDTLIGESICSTSGRHDVSKSLRESVRRRVGITVNKDIEHGHWRADSLSPRQVQYAATDVLVLPELYEEQLAKARDTGQDRAIQMEMDVMPIFTLMSYNGLPMDMDNLHLYMEQSANKAANAEVLLTSRLGAINFNSPAQLKKALESIGIPLESTAKDDLIDQILFDPESENSRLLQSILDWRAPHKRTEMYGSLEWQHQYIMPDGRIHPRFWQVGADTTRVASSDPNAQQIPKDGRWIIGNVPGHRVVSVDYSQIEVRISADKSNDQVLITMLEEDDVHRAIAAQVYKCQPSAVTPKQRKLAKAMVFTLLFGGGWQRFYQYARRNGSDMTEEEAMQLFKAFFEAFQGLWEMRCRANAMVRTRQVAVITLPNGSRRVLAGRKFTPPTILNTQVQGTAAVGMKLGLIEAYKQGLGKYMGAVVHDEAVSVVPDNEAKEYALELQTALVKGMKYVVKNCPVKAEIAYEKDANGKPTGELPKVWLA